MMYSSGSNLKLFAGNSHPALAKEIAEKLGATLGDAEVSRFSDGEIHVTIRETVRGADVFLIQSTSPPVNENFMETFIMVDAFRRASAGRITVVMPYFGYARQDRKAKARDPISAKLVADLIVASGADRILTMDLHAPQIQGFFDIPVDHLQGVPILAKYFMDKVKNMADVVVASPDIGSVTRARYFSERIDAPIAIIDKRRFKANVSEVMNVIGEVKHKKVIIVDDLIDTGGTIVNAAQALMDRGAKEVYACCTHAVLSGPAIERIQKSCIKELVTLNTVPLAPEKMIDKIKILSVGSVFAEAVTRISGNVSISTIFD